MNKMTILVIVILVILIGGYFVFNSGQTVEAPVPVSNDQEPDTSETNEPEDQASVNILVDSETLEGVLEDVADIGASGKSYLLRHEDRLYHRVEASLPEPEEGSVYEGWLVDQEPELKFFSTGIMQKNTPDMYVLSFEKDGASDEFDFVVITEETVVDETPEKHIIEGKVTTASARYYCDCSGSLTICPGGTSADTRDCQSCCSTYNSGSNSDTE